MAKLIWTEEALVWMHDIGQFLGEKSDAAAASVLDGIVAKAEM